MEKVPELKLEGRSGCRLEVNSKNGHFIVRKYSKEQDYNNRLLVQAAKQKQFEKGLFSFKVPVVLGISHENCEEAWFDMAYVHGQKYSEYLERISVTEVKKLAIKFNEYFAGILANSTMTFPDPRIFLAKIQSLESTLANRLDLDATLIDKSLEYLRAIPTVSIPVGKCHGDFTFSNMIFCDDSIYLVDFLDSFIESPLVDLVKFRQDTFFRWSLFIDNDFPEARATKIVQIFSFLDHEVFSTLAKRPDVNVWYSYLQIFNLLRILPYVIRSVEISFVQTCIRKLLISSK